MLDAVAGRAAGMIELRGADDEARFGDDVVAAVEVVEDQLGLEDVERHREHRRLHDLAQRLLDAPALRQPAEPEMEAVARQVEGGEERNAADMVDMGVGEQHVGLDRRAGRQQRTAERPDAGAGIKDEQLVVASHLDARRIAAVSGGAGSRHGDAAPHAPEPHGE